MPFALHMSACAYIGMTKLCIKGTEAVMQYLVCEKFFGTKPFVVVPLPGCSLTVVNKNGGGGGGSDCAQVLNLLKSHAPSGSPTCGPSAEPTAVPSAYMKTKR